MSEPESTPAENQDNGGARLYTLSEISQRSGISMPTLQRYKKLYQGRIPSVGKGRKQRYPEHALPVFDELKNENAGKRGRPRKDAAAAPRTRGAAKRASGGATRGRAAAAGGRKATASKRGAAASGSRKAAAKTPAKAPAKTAAKKTAPAARGRKAAAGARGGARGGQRSGSNLLTLTEVSKQTGISYPTLVRYVRVHSNKLPSEGTGRSRRFHPEAVDVFRQLRQESGRGGRKPAASKRAGGATATRGRGRAASGRTAAAPTDSGLQQRLKQLEARAGSSREEAPRFRDEPAEAVQVERGFKTAHLEGAPAPRRGFFHSEPDRLLTRRAADNECRGAPMWAPASCAP